MRASRSHTPRTSVRRGAPPAAAFDDDVFANVNLDGDHVLSRSLSADSVSQTAGFQVGYREGFEAAQQAGFEAGRAAGHRSGVAEGIADGQHQARDAALEEVRAVWAPRLDGAVRALTTAADTFAARESAVAAELETAVARLVFDLAEAVVGHHIDAGGLDGVDVVARALQLAPDGDAVVRLHPDDADTATDERVAQICHGRRVRVVADAAVDRGGAVVETADQTVDARIGAAFARAAAALGLDTRSPR